MLIYNMRENTNALEYRLMLWAYVEKIIEWNAQNFKKNVISDLKKNVIFDINYVAIHVTRGDSIR